MKKRRRRLAGFFMAVGFMAILLPAPLGGTAAANEVPEAAPAISGYTQYTSETLDETKQYLIVSKDSKGNLYALCGNPDGLESKPGELTSKGTAAAQLSVNGTTLTANHVKDNSSLTELEESLHFTVDLGETGYSFRSLNGYYLNLDTAMFSTEAAEFMVTVLDADYTIQHIDSKRFLSFNVHGETVVNGENNTFSDYVTDFWGPVRKPSTYKIYLYTWDGADAQTDTAAKPTIAEPEPPSGTTQGQPFAPNTGGSANFRIPAMVTLSDGTIVAAADARWNHAGDACSIDIMVSRSEDNGKTWEYSLPIYFNDSTDAKHNYGACFIDPVLVRDQKDKIYLMVDLYPGGIAINTAPKAPHAASGFVDINGEQRLVLYTTPNPDEQKDDNYTYYVGDHSDEDGLAPVYEVQESGNSGNTASYYMDRKFYLYDKNKEKLYCQQLNNTSAVVHQNVFFYNAELHVRSATYLYLVTSEDAGKSWSEPMLLNSQVRKDSNLDIFYGVGPGAGLCLEDGTIMLPAYTFRNQFASFVYSTDNGKNWTRSENATSGGRWSSESCLVQIDSRTVRQFYRSGSNCLEYTDHTKQDDGTWRAGEPVTMSNIPRRMNNQLSAIRYSKTINGKPVILVSTAASTSARQDGKIYVFTVNMEDADKGMELVAAYDHDPNSTTDYYAYSSIAEQKDGSIGLLYESRGSAITYKNISLAELAPEIVFDQE